MDQKWVKSRLIDWAQKAGLGLDIDDTDIQYIWNPGGFVNQSYQISDEKKHLHVKFAKRDHQPKLQQWARHNKHLTEHYQAPMLVMDIHESVIPDHPYGLVFEFFSGEVWENQAWTDEIFSKVSQLHGDQKLKRMLGAAKKRCTDAFIETYIHRFREDMKIIDANREILSFVEKETFEWFHDVTDQLEEEVLHSPHFDRPADDVVHNDLNQQNILVNADGFCMIDWDDLTLGDGAADYASLLWSWVYTEEWSMWEERVRVLAGDERFERMGLYFKAKLLDGIIDVLADYVEAEEFPDVKERTQHRAKVTHLHALELYKTRDGTVL